MPVEDRQELKRIRSLALRCVGAAISELVETLDALVGDPDLEPDDPPEEDGTEEQAAWIERVNQAKAPYTHSAPADYRNHEDAEDDEGGGDTSGDEGEPDFTRRTQKSERLYGPGCTISDPDLGAEEAGERGAF